MKQPIIVNNTSKGTITLLFSKDGSKEYDVLDSDGNYLGAIPFYEIEDNFDEEDLVELLEGYFST